jgi:F1F0 ATPase subunit 2
MDASTGFFRMTGHWTIWAIAIGLAAGFAAGAAHFVALRWNIWLFASGRFGFGLFAQAARCLLTALVLFALARTGWAALLAGMTGLLFARQAALRFSAVKFAGAKQ